MRRLCRARRGLCLDIVAGNTLFNFSLLGHPDNVRYYKVSSILSMLMTSSSNWLPSACDTIHLITLSRVHVACERMHVRALFDKAKRTRLKTGMCKRRRSITLRCLSRKLNRHRHYCNSYRNFIRIKRFAQKHRPRTDRNEAR